MNSNGGNAASVPTVVFPVRLIFSKVVSAEADPVNANKDRMNEISTALALSSALHLYMFVMLFSLSGLSNAYLQVEEVKIYHMGLSCFQPIATFYVHKVNEPVSCDP